jgi:tRNA-modifying protein YgfZ
MRSSSWMVTNTMNSERAIIDEQYAALTTGTAVVDLTDWSSISITGDDRVKFLNNFCTNDLKQLGLGGCCEVFFTNVKGKIVGHGLVECRIDELVFLGSPGQAEKLAAHLDRYVIREDVQLRNTTSESRFVMVAGSNESYANESGIPWPLFARSDVRVIDGKSNVSLASLEDRGYVNSGGEAFDVVRIESGFPLFGVEFGEDNLPQEIGRNKQAISFTKGCYLGQETVARIDALGHVNQQIVGVRFLGSEVPRPSLELTKDAVRVGRMTLACYSPKLGAPLGLAMVRRGANAIGTRLESPMGECEVIALPV